MQIKNNNIDRHMEQQKIIGNPEINQISLVNWFLTRVWILFNRIVSSTNGVGTTGYTNVKEWNQNPVTIYIYKLTQNESEI